MWNVPDSPDTLTQREASVGRVATIGVALALMALAADAFVSLKNVEGLKDRQKWVGHTHVALMKLTALRASVTDALAHTRGYLLDGDGGFLPHLAAAEQATAAEEDDVRSFTADNPRQTASVDQLTRQTTALFDLFDGQVKRRTAEGSAAPDVVKGVAEGHAQMDAIRSTLNAMQAEENRLLAIRDSASKGSLNETIATFLAAVAVAFGLVVLVYIMAVRDARARRREAAEAIRLARYNRLLIESTGRGHLRRGPGRQLHVPQRGGGADARDRTRRCGRQAYARPVSPPSPRRDALPGLGVPDLQGLQGRAGVPHRGRGVLPGGRNQLPGRVHVQPDPGQRAHRGGRRHLCRCDPTQAGRGGGPGEQRTLPRPGRQHSPAGVDGERVGVHLLVQPALVRLHRCDDGADAGARLEGGAPPGLCRGRRCQVRGCDSGGDDVGGHVPAAGGRRGVPLVPLPRGPHPRHAGRGGPLVRHQHRRDGRPRERGGAQAQRGAPAPGQAGRRPRQGAGRGGQHLQEPVPGQHEPRAADSAQRRHHVQRAAPGGGPGPECGGVHPRFGQDSRRRKAPARAGQWRAGPVQDRGGGRWTCTWRRSTSPRWCRT